MCDFFEKDNLEIPEGYFTFKNNPGECALSIGNSPNSIGIFTNILGIKFSPAWKNKKSFKYGVNSVRVISAGDIEKDFKFVQRLSAKLAKKYGYFLDELKKWRRK